MTLDEFLALPEMERTRWLADEVMGWKPRDFQGGWLDAEGNRTGFNPQARANDIRYWGPWNNIAHAKLVWERLHALGIALSCAPEFNLWVGKVRAAKRKQQTVDAPSLEEAICRAAFVAVANTSQVVQS